MSLGLKTVRGVLWNLAEQFSRRGTNVLVTLLLAYFLTPEDFGLIAMMALFLALGQSLMNSGFREALIRLEDATEADYTTAFCANVLLGLVSYGLLFALAPFIAEFYDEPRLTELVRVTSLSVIIMSFQVVQVASLSRALNFKVQLKASFPASVLSGITALLLAYLGMGVWALVAQMVLNSLIHTVLLWFLEAWRPRASFSKDVLKRLYGFGYKLFFAGALDTTFKNLYVLVVAKVFAASTAGLYFFATKLKELLMAQLLQAVQNVTYPALASVQSDPVRLKQGYRKIVILMTFVIFPVLIFLAALAEPLFVLLLPSKWHGAVPYFQLLCIASILLPLHSINLNILKVKGRSDLFLYLEIVKKIMSGLVLYLTYEHGVIAILLGQIATSMLSYLPNSYFSKRLLDYGIIEQLKDVLPILAVASVFGGVTYTIVNILGTSNALLSTLVIGPFFALTFFLAMVVFSFEIRTYALQVIQRKAS